MKRAILSAASVVALATGSVAVAPTSASAIGVNPRATYAPCASHPTEHIGSGNSCVLEIQYYLRSLGAYRDVPGVYGPWTANAVRFMQGEYDLHSAFLRISIDGVTGCQTYTFAFHGYFGSC